MAWCYRYTAAFIGSRAIRSSEGVSVVMPNSLICFGSHAPLGFQKETFCKHSDHRTRPKPGSVDP